MPFEVVDGKIVTTESREKQIIYTLEELQKQLTTIDAQISAFQSKKTDIEAMIAALQT